MYVWGNNEWIIPAVEINVYVGGQQPGQIDQAHSNVLKDSFKIM